MTSGDFNNRSGVSRFPGRSSIPGAASSRKGTIPLSRLNHVRTLLVGLALTLASTSPAAASWMMPPAFYRAKDFTVVKQNGVYHAYYILHNNTLPFPETENELGHATSSDLYTWNQQPPVLPRPTSGWERTHIWAPHIVKVDSVYFMFYTGVANGPNGPYLAQKTGLATSTDLYQWNPYGEPIFECGQVPWAFCDSMSYSSALRDPFVMRDPSTPGDWLMYYSTSPATDSIGMIAGVARSHGDFTQWADNKAMWATHHYWTGEWRVESVHLFEHAGLWYLFFTGGSSQPIMFMTGPDPLGAPETWTFRGTLSAMLGVDTGGWYASEIFSDGTNDYFCYVNGDRLEFQKIVWHADWQFHLTSPNPFHVVRLEWEGGSTADRDSVVVHVTSTFAYGTPLKVQAIMTYDDGAVRTLSQVAIGMPAAPALQSPSTSVTWRLRAPKDATTGAWPVSIVLRTPDGTCESAPLAITVPDTTGEVPPTDPGAPPSTPGSAGEEPGDGIGVRLPTFRLLSGAPVPGLALLVDLPASDGARVEVFDVQGRRVRSLVHRTLPSGATVLSWDRRDEAGVRVANGLYFARLTVGGRAFSARMVVR